MPSAVVVNVVAPHVRLKKTQWGIEAGNAVQIFSQKKL
jgi:hypothetical protein